MRTKEKGFTLIELLLVIMIIGILSAIAIPSLMNALHRSRQKRSMGDIRSIAAAWETYASESNRYSPAGLMPPMPDPASVDVESFVPQDLAALSDLLSPTYIRSFPTQDGWGNDFFFLVDTETGAQKYAIGSAGKDGARDPAITVGPTTQFENDIIYASGSFIQYPAGAQASTTGS